MRKGDETVKKQTRDQTPLAIRPRPRWSPGPPPCGEDRGVQRCPSCWTLAGAGLHGGGESASGPVSSLPGPSGSGPRSSSIVSGRMNGERGPVSLENEVRAELGRVLVYGRFLSGRQTPPGPAEGREDREAGVLRQMSRQPRSPFSGPSPPRPLSLTCGSSLTRPAGALVAALPGPGPPTPVDFIVLPCTR